MMEVLEGCFLFGRARFTATLLATVEPNWEIVMYIALQFLKKIQEIFKSVIL